MVYKAVSIQLLSQFYSAENRFCNYCKTC